jgi:catechol 2,3-dioxygenase-like lactoylglutathione lyase family enzyme
MEKRERPCARNVRAMDISVFSAFLPHTDPDASIAFYQDLLGFEITKDVGYNGLRWLTVAPAGQPGAVSIVLYPPGADPGVTDEERATIAEMMAKGTFAMLSFGTPDLEATFDALQAGGADIVSEPTDQPYGVRDASVRDPAGNLLRINQL